MDDINDFRPRNGWSLAAMIMFVIAFIIFIISIFVYESYRDKLMAWPAWSGFILALALLILTFSVFAWINIGGMRGYPRVFHYQPGWQDTKVDIGNSGEIVKVSYPMNIPSDGIVSVEPINMTQPSPSVSISSVPYDSCATTMVPISAPIY